MTCAYTAIIKKSGDFYVGLCLELNVASQGDNIEEATRMLQEACQEYLSFVKEEGIEDGLTVRWTPSESFLLEMRGPLIQLIVCFQKK